MADLSLVTLIPVTDDHFAFLLGEQSTHAPFSKPPGGVDTPGTLRMLRRMVARLHAAGCGGHWLILDGDEVVGLCGYKRPPDHTKTVEIGYGIVPSRWDQGFGTEAVEEAVELAQRHGAGKVIARTLPTNVASRRVLEKAGFSFVEIVDGFAAYGIDISR